MYIPTALHGASANFEIELLDGSQSLSVLHRWRRGELIHVSFAFAWVARVNHPWRTCSSFRSFFYDIRFPYLAEPGTRLLGPSRCIREHIVCSAHFRVFSGVVLVLTLVFDILIFSPDLLRFVLGVYYGQRLVRERNETNECSDKTKLYWNNIDFKN